MSGVYIIRKLSRDGCWPYGGPACERAGVPLEFTYCSKEDADADAALLREYNPVGFEVVETFWRLPQKEER